MVSALNCEALGKAFCAALIADIIGNLWLDAQFFPDFLKQLESAEVWSMEVFEASICMRTSMEVEAGRLMNAVMKVVGSLCVCGN